MSMFQKATKAQAKARIAVFGPSGSGKTYTSLAIAQGFGGRVALADSEHMSASKYASIFEFDTATLQSKNIDEYLGIIATAAQEKYDVLILDSLSHAWQELLQEIEKLAKAKYKGNTFRAWAEGTPRQRKLVDAILSFPGHLIATMRSKTEWVVEKNDRDKAEPRRVGTSPEQGKGIEYEFDLLLEMNQEHYGTVLKDRSGKFQDEIIEKPGVEFGKSLGAWLSDGKHPSLLQLENRWLALADDEEKLTKTREWWERQKPNMAETTYADGVAAIDAAWAALTPEEAPRVLEEPAPEEKKKEEVSA